MKPFQEYDIVIKTKAMTRTTDTFDMQRLMEKIEWALNTTPDLLAAKPSIQFITTKEKQND